MKKGDAVLVTKRKDTMLVDPNNIVVRGGFNVRMDMGDLEALADSIASMGQEIPVKAKKLRGEDKWELVDGHRRFAAIQILLKRGTEFPYVEVAPYVGNEEDQIFTMIVTGTGQKPLNEVEQAEAIKRLVAMHYKPEEICQKIGKSVPHIYNLLNLANVSKEIKNFVAQGLITGGTVVQIVKQTKDSGEQLKIVKDAIETAKTVAVAEGKPVKKATSKHVVALKTKTPIQKFKEVVEELDKRDKKSKEAELLIEIYVALKGDSVKNILKLIK
ncbi:MAG: ParB N-terminal domain-containing protein [Bacteroidota bacterium]